MYYEENSNYGKACVQTDDLDIHCIQDNSDMCVCDSASLLLGNTVQIVNYLCIVKPLIVEQTAWLPLSLTSISQSSL